MFYWCDSSLHTTSLWHVTFAAVSTKALQGAKSLGNFLFSAVNKAGKTVSEAGAKIKKTVEENVSIHSLIACICRVSEMRIVLQIYPVPCTE